MSAMWVPTMCLKTTPSTRRSTTARRASTWPIRPGGTSYGAYRQCAPGRNYWRVANYIFPFWTQTPQGAFDNHVHARAWVPLDDTHTMFIYVYWKAGTSGGNRERPPLRNGKLGAPRPHHDYQPNTTDWFGRWRITGNEFQRLAD